MDFLVLHANLVYVPFERSSHARYEGGEGDE
jgi:hypothetical protein